jgi:hypothetical protein
MLLYCREQVEDFAFKKWQSADGLDAEFEKRFKSCLIQERKLKKCN